MQPDAPRADERFQLYFAIPTDFPVIVHGAISHWWKTSSRATPFSDCPLVPFRVTWAMHDDGKGGGGSFSSLLRFYLPASSDTEGYRAALRECIRASVPGATVDDTTFRPHGAPVPLPDTEVLFFPNGAFSTAYEEGLADHAARQVDAQTSGPGTSNGSSYLAMYRDNLNSHGNLAHPVDASGSPPPPPLPSWVAEERSAARARSEEEIFTTTLREDLCEQFGIKPRLDGAFRDQVLPACLICGGESADVQALPCEHLVLCERCFDGNFSKSAFIERCPDPDCLQHVSEYRNITTDRSWSGIKNTK